MMGTKSTFRYDIVSAIAPLCAASGGTQLFLFFAYFSSHPTTPNAALGFVHALNNHGSYVYISDTESTGLSLLMNVFFAGLVGMFVVVPKNPAPPGTARWVTHFNFARPDYLASHTIRQKTIFLCSLMFYLAVIWLAGPWIVRLVVSRGFVR
jgi:hypothetical protein